MNESRALTIWAGLGLVLVAGVFLLLIGQIGRWTGWSGVLVDPRGNGPANPPSMPTGGAAESDEEPSAPAVTAARELWADRLLDVLRSHVQSVGAIENEAVLTFKSKEAYEAFLKRAEAAGLRLLGTMERLNAARVGYDRLESLRSELLNNPDAYEDIGANYLVKVPGLPPAEDRSAAGSAPFGDSVMPALGANTDRSTWGQGVTVAVLDTGVFDHPTFRPGQVRHFDLVQDGQPIDGHGTAMASLIAGTQYGAEGVAPAAGILDVRVAGPDRESDSFLLAQGIYTAIDNGAQIINISMGSYGDASVVRNAVKDAQQAGAIVFASVGNEQAGVKAWPAAYPGVMAVSGVDAQLKLAYFSNSGDPTVAAPAVSIPSAYFEDGRGLLVHGSGTSQASALAAGLGATYRSWGFNVPSAMVSRARPTGATSHEVGAGVISVGAPR